MSNPLEEANQGQPSKPNEPIKEDSSNDSGKEDSNSKTTEIVSEGTDSEGTESR